MTSMHEESVGSKYIASDKVANSYRVRPEEKVLLSAVLFRDVRLEARGKRATT